MGLLVGAGSHQGWQRILIESLGECDDLEITLYSRPNGAVARPSFFWRVADWLERRTFARVITRRLSKKGKGFSKFIKRMGREFTQPVKDVGSLFAQPGGANIKEPMGCAPNLLLALEVSPDEWERLQQLDCEVWRIQTEGCLHGPGAPLGLLEFFKNEPLCGVRIIRNGDPAPYAAGRYCAYSWSWTVNSYFLAAKAALLVKDSLRRGALPGSGEARVDSAAPRFLDARELTFLFAVTALTRLFLRNMRHFLDRLLRDDYWTLKLFEAGDGLTSFRQIGEIASTRGSYFADPFLLRRNSKTYIFCEEYPYVTRRGIISCIELQGPRRRARMGGEPQSVLSLDAHLSYPFVLEWGDDLLMAPDNNSSGFVELWRCESFPSEWRPISKLISGVSAADSSLLHHAGKWWLFTNLDRSGLGDHRDELHIYFSNDLLAENWRAHPLNPVVVDAGRARMAGGFIRLPDGTLLRCGQVQGERYGMAVNYCEIEKLSETHYEERPNSARFRIPELAGARHHHLCLADDLVVADTCVRTWKIGRKILDRFGAKESSTAAGSKVMGSSP